MALGWCRVRPVHLRRSRCGLIGYVCPRCAVWFDADDADIGSDLLLRDPDRESATADSKYEVFYRRIILKNFEAFRSLLANHFRVAEGGDVLRADCLGEPLNFI